MDFKNVSETEFSDSFASNLGESEEDSLWVQLVAYIYHIKTSHWYHRWKIQAKREGRMAMDHEERPEDEDGIRQSQLRNRFEGTFPLNEW